MKRLSMIIAGYVVLCSTLAFAELHVIDADGNDLGIFVSTNSKDYGDEEGYGSLSQCQRHIIYNPSKKVLFELKWISNTEKPYPTADITPPLYLYFTNKGCTGKVYTTSFAGIKSGLVKYNSKYYKTTPNPPSRELELWSYGSIGSNGELTCRLDYSDPYKSNGPYSLLSPINKPFSFLPARFPFTLQQR